MGMVKQPDEVKVVLEGLERFVDRPGPMPEAAAQLLEMVGEDSIEVLGRAGKPVLAGDFAERLETKLSRVLRGGDDPPEGTELIEETVAHLRSQEDRLVAPYAFEDSDGIHWFVLSSGREVLACYTTRPFVEAES